MSSTAPTGPEDRTVWRRVIARILLGIALVVIFLFALVYCTSHAGSPSDPGSATPTLPAFTGSARPTPVATTVAATAATRTPQNAGATASAGTTKAATPATSKAGNSKVGSSKVGSSTAGSATAGSSRVGGSGAAPRSAPNTGGGSDSGAVDIRLVTGGTLLVLASIGLALVTLRRWRRAW